MTITTTNPVVGIAGDWHGDLGWALSMVSRFHKHKIDTILHLGDFGIWRGPHGDKYLRRIHSKLEEYGMAINVTLGNHEDYDRVRNLEANKDGLLYDPKYPTIRFFPRGFSWVWNDHKFLSLGGANSIDRNLRTMGKDWWEGEQITDADVHTAISHGKVDVMLTHDAPSGTSYLEQLNGSSTLPFDIQLWVKESADQVKKALDVNRPEILFHGHYHRYEDTQEDYRVMGQSTFYSTRVISMDMNTNKQNIGLLDTRDLAFTIL